jgi:hypothetical protein
MSISLFMSRAYTWPLFLVNMTYVKNYQTIENIPMNEQFLDEITQSINTQRIEERKK